MNSREITLWIDSRLYDALAAALAPHQKTPDGELQNRLQQLCEQMIPAEQRQKIAEEIQREDAAREQERLENRRFSAFRITDRGKSVCIEYSRPFTFLQAAYQTRRYLQGEMDQRVTSLAGYFMQEGVPISGSAFDELAGQRIDRSVNITGVFDIDLDNKEFATADPNQGWTNYALGDVASAIFYAYRKERRSDEERWNIVHTKLEGKEIGMEQNHSQQM